MILSERSLQFDFSMARKAQRFDNNGAPGLSHCMKAVDFVVETDDRILLIEVKDFDDPQAQRAAQQAPPVAAQIKADLESLQQGKWTVSVFAQKCRDTLLYQWGTGQLDFTQPPKPIYYYVVIASTQLQPADLLAELGRLRRSLPLVGPPGLAWRKPIEDCLVFNLESWNRYFGASFPLSRHS